MRMVERFLVGWGIGALIDKGHEHPPISLRGVELVRMEPGTPIKLYYRDGWKGAEHLLGAGDMLIRMPGEAPKRAHGVFVRLENVVQMVAAAAAK